MSHRTAVLLLTHVWTPVVLARFERLRREIGERADVFLLRQGSVAAFRAMADVSPVAPATIMFDRDRLESLLGYPYYRAGRIVPGSTHFPVLAIARCKPAYSHFMVIEFDVEFSGDWGALFDRVVKSGTDFAATHFRTFAFKPEWPFWLHTRPAEADRDWAMDTRNLRRSFNPIYLLSRKAIDLVEAAHRGGWRAHNEILFATILSHHGCEIVDLAESGLCIGHEQDPLPDEPVTALSTMRWRPSVTSEEFEARSTGDTLFHPVKESWIYDGSRVVEFTDSQPRPAER